VDQARSLDQLADRPELSCTLDEACLQMYPRRDLTDEQADAAANGRALTAAGIGGVYAATAPDGRVIALLRDDGSRTKSVVVIRPATL
jgi:tRNA pseudouridine55 synthase